MHSAEFNAPDRYNTNYPSLLSLFNLYNHFRTLLQNYLDGDFDAGSLVDEMIQQVRRALRAVIRYVSTAQRPPEMQPAKHQAGPLARSYR